MGHPGPLGEGRCPSALPKWGPEVPTTPMWRALRPSTPGDFPNAGKVTKGAPRAAPFGIPWCGISALIGAALTLAPGLPSATKKDRFATLGWWANRSFFSPQAIPRVTPSAVNPWRGSCFVACVLPGVAALSGGNGEAVGGMIMPPKGSTQRGCPPLGDSLVTFSSGRRSPGVEGRSALLSGAVGAKGPHLGSAEGYTGGAAPRYCAYSSQSCAKVQNAFSAVLRWAVAGVMVSRSPFQRRSTVTSASSRRICSITLAGMLV